MTKLQFDDDGEDDFDIGRDEPEPVASPSTPEIYHKRPGTKPANEPTKGGNRNLRIRPMSPAMREKHPDVLVITLTRTDGRQLIFVRK